PCDLSSAKGDRRYRSCERHHPGPRRRDRRANTHTSPRYHHRLRTQRPPTSHLESSSAMIPLRTRAADYFRSLQDNICTALESLDGAARFREDTWQRPGGGGGRTRVLAEGAVFEKGGVNCSEVFGQMAPESAKQIPGEGLDFTATGISLVLHPRNP